MKIAKICSFAVLCIAAGAAPAWVAAQQPGQPPAAAPAPPPPEMENLNEVEAPSVTIQTPQEQREKTITEKREGGKVTEVKVESKNSTYYLRPKPIGTPVTGAADSAPQTNPTWNVKEFDWGGKKQPKNNPGAGN
ncbi:MAG TPA: DUF2782 domain-containing protein [Herbaspirillum sp.]|jgi:hypothetical protein